MMVSKSYHPPSFLKSILRLAFSSALRFNTLGCLLLSASGRAKCPRGSASTFRRATNCTTPVARRIACARTTAETTETALNGGWSRRCVLERCFACLERAAPLRGELAFFFSETRWNGFAGCESGNRFFSGRGLTPESPHEKRAAFAARYHTFKPVGCRPPVARAVSDARRLAAFARQGGDSAGCCRFGCPSW